MYFHGFIEVGGLRKIELLETFAATQVFVFDMIFP